ncbi:DUF6048 family protein [Gaetbulibacter aestuarii]|uniref:DUF6048 family protein n=1 Tax=Gaetbulibacter aestuarii TaxID=1502358 RepID=A0ABW7N0G1_9FLAO
MKLRRNLSYYISFVLLFICLGLQAQNDSIPEPVKDTLGIKQKYGLRIGGDVSKLIRSFYDDNFSGFEVVADYRIKKSLYIAGELGYAEKNTANDYLDVTSKGSYLKGGIDYNLYTNWLDMDNMIYAGFRVGVSSFTQVRNAYTIYNTNQYWAPQFSTTESKTYSGLTAVWAELQLGIKAEIFNNLYFGVNVQLKMMASETVPENFGNLYIPGFNKTNDSSGIGVGWGYIISYRIPLYKK